MTDDDHLQRAVNRQHFDMQAMFQRWNATAAKNIEEMRLRQWCIEQSVQTYKSYSGGSVVQTAEEILAFVTQPVASVFTSPGTDQPAPPSDQTAASWPADAPR